MLEVFRRFGSVQYDPIDVAGRTHDLMLHARVADYDSAWCDELYERREIFEAYNKGLSFVYAPEFPWFRGTARRLPERDRGEPRGGRAGARTDPLGRAAVVARLRERAREHDRLVRGPDQHCPRAARGIHGHGRAGSRASRGQAPVLRPARAAVAGEAASARGAVARTDAPQVALALSLARPARRGRGRRHLRRHRPREARPALSGQSGPDRAARGARRERRPRSGSGRGRERQALRAP